MCCFAVLKKLKPELEAEGKEKTMESRAEKQERVNSEPPPPAALCPITSSTTVTNTSDLNDSREINFEYLKHVVLKFMSCREAEVGHPEVHALPAGSFTSTDQTCPDFPIRHSS